MPVNNVPMGGWCHELASSASVGAMGGREVGGGRSTVHGRWEGGPPGRSAVHGRDQSPPAQPTTPLPGTVASRSPADQLRIRTSAPANLTLVYFSVVYSPDLQWKIHTSTLTQLQPSAKIILAKKTATRYGTLHIIPD